MHSTTNTSLTPTKKILFDVTLLRKFPKRPTGILRVCAEFCNWFLKNAPSQVEFCFFEKTVKQFFFMHPSQIEAIVNTMCSPSPSTPLPKPSKSKLLQKIILLAKKFTLIVSSKRVNFKDYSIYFDLGLNARKSYLTTLLKHKMRHNFKLVTFCHDLIPALEPQFAWVETQKAFADINHFFKFIGEHSAHIFCVSKHTQKDLSFFLDSNNIPHPKMSIFINGSNLTHSSSTPLNALQDLIPNNFILYVSSIDKRKNHQVIYKAYRLLKEKGKENLPKIVFVGAHLGDAKSFLNYITWDPKVKDLFLTFDNVSDLELDWLYKNCLFTLYPSLYEGWGIPVAESLAHGKFCLASNATSIPEVGGDFVDYVHPLDTFAWATKISDYIDNPTILHDRTQRIKEQYKPQIWDTSIKEAYETLLELCTFSKN